MAARTQYISSLMAQNLNKMQKISDELDLASADGNESIDSDRFRSIN